MTPVRAFTRSMLVLVCLAAGWFCGAAVRAASDVREVRVAALSHARFGDAGMSVGPADARVTLRIFGDYECPACRELEREAGEPLRKLAREGRLRVVYHHAPLRGHWRGPIAAAAAYCAAESGRGWPVHRVLYETSFVPIAGRLSMEPAGRIVAAAARTGADPAVIRACLDSRHSEPRVRRDRELADELDVHAVPTLFLDDARLEFRSFKAVLRHVARRAAP